MEVDSAPIMAALILTLSIIWFLRNMIKTTKKRVTFPPGPLNLPIVGYLPFLRRDIHRQFTELAAKYGPIYKLRFGSKFCTVISSASLAKEVFRDNDVLFSQRNMTLASGIVSLGFNDIAWTPYGQGWRDRRKIFSREMMSNNNMKASVNLRKDAVRKGIREIYAAEKGTPVNIFELGLRIDLDLITNMIWGGRIGSERRDRMSSELLPIIGETVDLTVKPNISDFFPLFARFDFQGISKDITALMRKFEAVMQEAIDERIKNPDGGVEEEGRKDFMQILVELMQEESYKSSLGQVQIKAMFVDMLLGGTDTSSTTMEWVMALLIQHPRVMEKVQHELDEVVGMNNIVEETHIPKLVYLYSVLKEAMRVYPLGALIPRTLLEDCVVGGYTIPKDSFVFINVWSIHRDPAAWEDPSEFRPERFLDDEIRKREFKGNDFNYTPFGSGRRVCAGMVLAERMMMHILASLLHSFEWRMPDGNELDMSEVLVSALKKRIPLSLVPMPRLPSPDLYA